ncbi:kinase-like domain-containing protein [Chaetomium tenue]|uniref:Kinase-like domain-containing protein n=1 Tax=Chaetomium tenue TaxID=1854479 RepID=A0ACB7PIG6_9PEZI|nr:kinase-like domain-containing protein [Chaetomium globosum]
MGTGTGSSEPRLEPAIDGAFDGAKGRTTPGQKSGRAGPLLPEEKGLETGPATKEFSATLPGVPSLGLPPTITTEHEMLIPKKLEVLGVGGSSYVYKCHGDLAYKVNVTEREVDLMTAAGDCAITPLCHVLAKIDGAWWRRGLIMELATPFDFKLVPAKERMAVKDEMVSLVDRLHSSEIGIAHGDIKPDNFLRCHDGKLRLCDFDSAWLLGDDEVEDWEGGVSDRYLAPSRGYPDTHGPPTIVDDNYALAISVWELFTGKDALIDEDIEDALMEGKTVDLDELEDEDVRTFVWKRLRDGGAKVPDLVPAQDGGGK